jgi:hypothetical protein
MGFGEIFGKSWKDYKANFASSSLIMLFFYLIPWLILFFLSYIYPKESYFIILLSIAFFLISSYGIAGLIKTSFRKKKFTFSQAVKSIKSRYWAYIGFTIVLMLYLVGLFFLMIIPGIIFMVYWIFSSYVFLGDGKGINESLKESKKVVKGNWWRVVGYVILLILIYILLAIIVGIILSLFGLVITGDFDPENPNIALSLVDLLLSFFTTPFAIYFGKNFYFKLKGKK